MAKFTILVDTREQIKWTFEEDKYCRGFKIGKVDTGDYTIEGIESKLCIERKRSTSEISTNFFEDRFDKELDRMNSYKYKYIICEFTYEDLFNFPRGSGIPINKWKYLKSNAGFLVAKMINIQINRGINFILAGKYAKSSAYSIMKQVARNEKLI